MMGVVFQLPVVSYLLASLGIISSELLGGYRRHAVMVIAIVSAIITPPDIMTCILVMGPLYLLYECSIWVVAYVERKQA
jgi:sec-independent protein translocase protein TatC